MSEILALSAAFCIALSSMFISELRGQVSLPVLARWQMLATFAMTGAVSLIVSGWRTVGSWQLELLTLSGVAGIAVASTTYFATIYAVGPRITALLFALAAPTALGLGYVFLDEAISLVQGCGVALVLSGVVLAVGGPDGAEPREVAAAAPAAVPDIPEQRHPSFGTGVMLGVLTALGQAVGSLLARPAMASGVEPFTAMAIRSGVAMVLFLASSLVPGVTPGLGIRPRALGLSTGSAFLGTTLGMSLLMAALHSGDVGVVTTLSSTTPVLVLPLVWMRSGTPPTARAWLGSLLAIIGVAVISRH